MKKRRLGKTEMFVTEISLGALPLQRCTYDEANIVLNKALDMGINFIDTARAYTDSEDKIGRFISKRRKDFYLATKSMARDKQSMADDIDFSLKTLCTEYIDLYQIHNIKTKNDFEKVMAPGGALEALLEAKQAGKIGHIGVTGHNLDYLLSALKTDAFSTVMVPFNCIETGALNELFPYAISKDIGRIVMKPLGGGQITQAQLALKYILEQDISVIIPGMDSVEQLEENLAVTKDYKPLTSDEKAALSEEAKTLGTKFCRRCGYCMPCAVGIDIPTMFIFHLQYKRYGLTEAIPKRYQTFPAKASDCIECGICESRCPYDYPIREHLKQVAKDLG